jgi:hypothetical protein
VVFDDERAVANAGVMLPALLAQRLGIEALVDAGRRGYHPILATRAGTGEVLHIPARKGSANTARGALRFVEELIARVQRAWRHGPEAAARGLGLLEQEDLRSP